MAVWPGCGGAAFFSPNTRTPVEYCGASAANAAAAPAAEIVTR